MSKKIEILDAASRVVVREGVDRLTLETVAKEAGVSKGGLLYHYSTKDALIMAMNVYVIERFREKIDSRVETGVSFHEAYLLGTLDGFSKIIPSIAVVIGFGSSLFLLSLALIDLPLGFTYAIWAANGTILTAFVGVYLFKEKINTKGVVGISLMVSGIILLNIA
ncbi:SMR family transporter [Halalkalibacillus halophilus]|uniref:SMR family transporter n=1 Tax=Halalkalibacillus halophilus TaxID=392827 RepID=UPI000421B814|nr:SMR family transporter [Halalkalibacillus halophilus]